MSALGANATYFEQHYPPEPGHQGQGLINRNYQSFTERRPVKSEGTNFKHITFVAAYTNEASSALDEQISSLRRDYGFSDPTVVTKFLRRHRTIRTVLQNALPQLQDTFGVDKIFNLEVSKDEDGFETMYAVAIWQEDVGSASKALHEFLENWWLHHMNAATSDLAFIYKLV